MVDRDRGDSRQELMNALDEAEETISSALEDLRAGRIADAVETLDGYFSRDTDQQD